MKIAKTILVGLFTATMFVIPITAAQAVGDCVVDDFSNDAGSDTNGDRTFRFCMTDAAGAAAGETITFNHGNSQQTIELASSTVDSVVRTGSVTIDGEDYVTITLASGQSGFSMIETDSDIEVIGMKFEDGEAEQGSVIKSTSGTITVRNSEFTDNEATIVVLQTPTDNEAQGGGAIKGESDVFIYGSTFARNISGRDGGVILAEGDVTIDDSSVFNNNTAGDDGGAIYSRTGAITVLDSSFTGNKATEDGGTNYDDSEGGALYASGSSGGTGDVSITNSDFDSNESDQDGGAISAAGSVTITSESTFTSNTAGDDGGAVYASQAITVTNSTFTTNKATEGIANLETSRGGALYSSESNITVTGSTFTENESDNGGGAIYADLVATINSSTFLRNEAGTRGGAVVSANLGVNVTDNSTFTANKALGGDGGAIWADEDIDIDDSTFTSNISTLDGGAISGDNDVLIEDSSFTSNEAKNGGAVRAESDFEPTRSSFVSNRAANHGGAAYVEGNDTDIEYSYFAYNKADYDSDGNSDGTGDGGAVWVDEHLHVTNSTFYQNSGENGGAVYANTSTDDGFIVYSTFLDNTSESDGPSVVWQNGELDLMGSIFVGSQDKSQVVVESGATSVDHGANVTSYETITVFDNTASQTGVSLSSFGVSTPATATLSLRPTVPFSFRSPIDFAVTDDVITSFNTADVGESDTDAPTDDQAGTTRTTPFTTGAEYLSIYTAPVPYSGPIITDVGGNGIAAPFSTFEGETVRVVGERLSTVSKVFVDDKEGEVISAADDHFIMKVPEGVSPGTHDLKIQSSIGNLTYLDGLVVSSAGADNAAANAVCEGVEPSWWTQRISDAQAKAYIKCPAEGQKYRILRQTGGSGDYNSVFVKTLTDENDQTQVFNEFGRYIVRTIDLEDINRLRITVDDEELWKVRYNR